MTVVVKHLDHVVPEPGSCGTRRRLISSSDCDVLGLSYVAIANAKKHFHPKSWEIYYVLSGEGFLEIDAKTIPLTAGATVLVPPGAHHRAVSTSHLEVLVIMSPASAEADDIAYVEDRDRT